MERGIKMSGYKNFIGEERMIKLKILLTGFKKMKGSYTIVLEGVDVDRFILKESINKLYSFKAKDYPAQYSYEFDDIWRLNVYHIACKILTKRIEGKRAHPSKEIFYSDLGYFVAGDKVSLRKTKDKSGNVKNSSIIVEINNQRLKEAVVSAWLRLPASVFTSLTWEDFEKDIGIVQDYMNFSAKCLVDSLLGCTLTDKGQKNKI